MIGLDGKTIASEHLSMRLLEEGDKKDLRTLLSDEDVTRPAGFLPAASDAEFDDFFATLTKYNTAIAVLLGSKLIGYCYVGRFVAEIPEAEKFKGKQSVSLGFVIGKEYQNHGYGTEMLRTVTSYLLERFDAVFADCFVGNTASQKLIEKCGYRYLGNYTLFFEELSEKKTCRCYVRDNNL